MFIFLIREKEEPGYSDGAPLDDYLAVECGARWVAHESER